MAITKKINNNSHIKQFTLGDVFGRPRTNLNVAEITAIPATYNATTSNDVIVADATAATLTINLPPLAGSQGKILYIKKIDSTGNTVIVDANGSELIDGSLTSTLSSQYQFLIMVAGITHWWKLST